MISRTNETKDALRRSITAAIAAAQQDGTLPQGTPADFVVEVPQDTAKGDFATNAAMANARALHAAPAKIAEALLAHIDLAGTGMERCEVAGPGFINFFAGQRWFSELVDEIAEKGKAFGRSDYGRGEKVMVEFVSANPTGPMHMGNARGGAIGDVLSEVLAWSGCDVTREFYVNDAGNQIEKFGESLSVRYLQLFLGEDAVEFPEDGYHGDDIKDHAGAFAILHGDRYLNADPAERRQALIDYALPRNLAAMKADLEHYRITYDVWFNESVMHAGKPNAIDNAIALLAKRELTYEKEGALWYRATEFGAEKDEVLVRANGLPTYFAADIAYHWNKFAERGFARVINVWGADHHGHVARLKGAMDAIGLDGSKLDIVLMQLVRLVKDGEPYRMSKRSGKAITLTDLLEEVPIDAARFFFNMREPGSSFDFDLDLAIQQSADNPVYYVQYAHARICSIAKLLAAEGYTARRLSPAELDLLTAPEEHELIRLLGALPETIIESARQYDPAKMTHYATDVATLFHKFYHNCHVKGETPALRDARAALCAATATVLENVLSILKITAPDIM